MPSNFRDVTAFKAWFEAHVSLSRQSYTLDLDQARAVLDHHKNTLITARAGSGKTRVIVAKVAYLVASGQAKLSEIAAFMFNRTAAAEVNERIGAVEIDGVSLKQLNHNRDIKVASTFHKFALDLVKSTGECPELISEAEHDAIIKRAVHQILDEENHRLSPPEYADVLRLASSFIARAGQQYTGESGLTQLCADVQKYISQHRADNDYSEKIWIHKLCLAVYQEYLLALNYPQIDFNILMTRATRLLSQNAQSDNLLASKIQRYKYIMVDEYQDFSYLFFGIIQALRKNCPAAHLFAVGDDWQAINRFAGSDVQYFIDFAKFFPEDIVNIPLNTNYRSDRKIVENANKYMLKHYNPKAQKAVAFSSKRGKIKIINPSKTRFDKSDLLEDALHDARYQIALAKVCGGQSGRYDAAAQHLKTVTKIIKHHKKERILLLHRHNFTTFTGVSLGNFYQALQEILVKQRIMNAEAFTQRVRAITMHKSKGLESDVVILLEFNREQVLGQHPHSTIFGLFGDTLSAEKADQHRLLYVALTRAKHQLYALSSDRKPVI